MNKTLLIFAFLVVAAVCAQVVGCDFLTVVCPLTANNPS